MEDWQKAALSSVRQERTDSASFFTKLIYVNLEKGNACSGDVGANKLDRLADSQIFSTHKILRS